MNGCNKSFNTTEALQRHLQRHFARTPTPPPPPPPPPPRPIAILKGANKLSKKNSPSQGNLSDLELASSLSCSQSADEEYLTEEGFGDAEDESDDSYVPGSQTTSKCMKVYLVTNSAYGLEESMESDMIIFWEERVDKVV